VRREEEKKRERIVIAAVYADTVHLCLSGCEEPRHRGIMREQRRPAEHHDAREWALLERSGVAGSYESSTSRTTY
jgi:hypothetical protein